jgi:hypothetical protein
VNGFNCGGTSALGASEKVPEISESAYPEVSGFSESGVATPLEVKSH